MGKAIKTAWSWVRVDKNAELLTVIVALVVAVIVIVVTAWSWIGKNAESLTAVIAFVAACTAIRYYRQYHREVLQKNTMDLFDRFESDPVINASLSYLSRVKEKNKGDYAPTKDPLNERTKFHVTKVLNFFEGIAHRMEKGIVDRKAVESQFKNYIVVYVDVFIKNKNKKHRKCSEKLLEPEDINEVKCLMALHKKWTEPTPSDGKSP